MNVLESTIPWVRKDSSLVALLQVVANVNKGCTFEGWPKLTCLGITWDQSCEPVIHHAHAWDDLALAKVLEAALAEDRELSDGITRFQIGVGLWEDLSMVQKDEFDTSDRSFVNTKSDFAVNLHADVVNVLEASWVFGQVPGYTLSVPVIVG